MSEAHQKQGLPQDGTLISVLSRASHDDLLVIAEALDRSFDVTIKQDKRYGPAAADLTAIPEVIAEHVTRAGGNSFANIWRGGVGPSYTEVLRDVCGVMSVKVPKEMGIVEMEEKLLHDVMERVWNKMSPEERADTTKAAEENLRATQREFKQNGSASSHMTTFSFLAGQVGSGVTTHLVQEMAFQMMRTVSRYLFAQVGVRMSTTAAAGWLISLANPIFTVFSVAWTASTIAGPSYRGLTPAIFHVASLRQQLLWQEEEEPEAV